MIRILKHNNQRENLIIKKEIQKEIRLWKEKSERKITEYCVVLLLIKSQYTQKVMKITWDFKNILDLILAMNKFKDMIIEVKQIKKNLIGKIKMKKRLLNKKRVF